MGSITSVVLILIFLGGSSAFVFSCNEIKDKLINKNLEESTQFVCLVPQEGYSAFTGLESIYAQNDKVSTSFNDLINTTCVERPGTGSWRIVADLPVNLDCSMELTLIFTSSPAPISQTKEYTDVVYFANNAEQVLVAPQTGFWLSPYCRGSNGYPTDKGTVTVYTGAGTGVEEYRYFMASWTCDKVPTFIQSFDNVVTIVCDDCETGVYFQVAAELLRPYNYVTLDPVDHVVVMSSGRSDNAQILYPDRKQSFFRNQNLLTANVGVSSTFGSDFDYVTVQFQDDCINKVWTEKFQNVSNTTSAVTNWVTVEYVTNGKQDLWDSPDNFVVEITTTNATPCATTTKPPPTTTRPSTTTKAPSSNADAYCNCAVDKFGMPLNDLWDPLEIWLDVVIILDVTSDMGDVLLGDASTLIESFFGSDDGDVLNTNTNANFFTRVGLIAMSDKPETIYNLNMTKADKVVGKVQIKAGVSSIDVIGAFNAAQNMLNDGLKTIPSRSSTRQVIYYMTNADPKFDPNTLESFKKTGIIIVNDFVENGNINRPGLKDLASPGYYHNDIQDDYMDTIHLFCKANCYCRAEVDLVPYAGSNKDIALQAAGGCYRASSVGAQYGNAKSNCATTAPGGALVASIHDGDKGAFVNDLVIKSGTTKDYYWIGYTKTDAGVWKWEDQSTNPYEHWDTSNGEPLQNSASKCTYVDKTTILWGAGNCNTGMPFVCEYTPCQVGNKNC